MEHKVNQEKNEATFSKGVHINSQILYVHYVCKCNTSTTLEQRPVSHCDVWNTTLQVKQRRDLKYEI